MTARARLGLGTVQFGLDYGVSNTSGQVGGTEVGAILDCAAEAGICVLDTAAAYGDSEQVLGERLDADAPFHIVTKTLPVRGDKLSSEDVGRIEQGFAASLRKLQRTAVDAVLVHHADDLLVSGGDALYARLQDWRATGRTRRVGVSVYDRAQVDQLFSRYDFDVVQLPLNIFDQRLLRDGTLAALHARGVDIHVRSVFLQGALLVSSERLPAALSPILAHHRHYMQMLAQAGISPAAAALGFVAGLSEVGVALVGVTSRQDLQDCIAAYDEATVIEDATAFSLSDENLIDPRRWRGR